MHGKSQWHIFMHLHGNKKLARELQMQKMDHPEIGFMYVPGFSSSSCLQPNV